MFDGFRSRWLGLKEFRLDLRHPKPRLRHFHWRQGANLRAGDDLLQQLARQLELRCERMDALLGLDLEGAQIRLRAGDHARYEPPPGLDLLTQRDQCRFDLDQARLRRRDVSRVRQSDVEARLRGSHPGLLQPERAGRDADLRLEALRDKVAA